MRMSRSTKQRLMSDEDVSDDRNQVDDADIPRSGKWSSEEESFANRLIIDFENGSLKDCEDGCTLRSYLARKLRCAPMRISKKFAGRCIGKLVFSRRLTEFDEEHDGHGTLQHLEDLYKRSCQSSLIAESSRSEYYVSDSISARSSGSFSSDEEISSTDETDGESIGVMMSGNENEDVGTDESDGFVFNFAYSKSAADLQALPPDIDDYAYGVDFESEFGYENFFLGDDRPVCIEAEDEWRDVLSYFCGDEAGHCGQSSSSSSSERRLCGMKRTLSTASLLL